VRSNNTPLPLSHLIPIPMGRKPGVTAFSVSPVRKAAAGGGSSPPSPARSSPPRRCSRLAAAAGLAAGLAALLALAGLPSGAWGGSLLGESGGGAGATLVTSHGGRFPVREREREREAEWGEKRKTRARARVSLRADDAPPALPGRPRAPVAGCILFQATALWGRRGTGRAGKGGEGGAIDLFFARRGARPPYWSQEDLPLSLSFFSLPHTH
jgi:hypothetical protein